MPLRKAVSETSGPAVLPNPPLGNIVVTAPKPAPKADKPMTRGDWDSKDRRISRQGLFQAALQSPALMQYAPTLEAYIELVVRTANAGLEFVNQA